MDNIITNTNFARWDSALQTGDPLQVAALYNEHLTLLPTMATQVIHDRAGAVAYFTFFGSFHPTVEMMQEHTVPITEDSYLHCGVYRFVVDTPEGKREPLDARFTMLWKKNGDTWEILHHHSSRIPVV